MNLNADCLSKSPVEESIDDTDEKLKTANLIQLDYIFMDQENNIDIQSKNFLSISEHNFQLYMREFQ